MGGGSRSADSIHIKLDVNIAVLHAEREGVLENWGGGGGGLHNDTVYIHLIFHSVPLQ